MNIDLYDFGPIAKMLDSGDTKGATIAINKVLKEACINGLDDAIIKQCKVFISALACLCKGTVVDLDLSTCSEVVASGSDSDIETRRYFLQLTNTYKYIYKTHIMKPG